MNERLVMLFTAWMVLTLFGLVSLYKQARAANERLDQIFALLWTSKMAELEVEVLERPKEGKEGE